MSRKERKAIKPARPPAALARGKRLWFAGTALVLAPVVSLGVLEVGLRLGGFGHPTSFFLERQVNGADYLIENDKFGWRFFPSQLARSPGTLKFAEAKEPGAFRIFVFGESAALGDPKPACAAGRYLEVLLRDRFPGTKFEVITVAMTAINSHAVLPMARECARLDGDFWVIYMGNNEMAGPFGVNPISGPAAPDLKVVRLSLALRATRIGQLLEKITAPFLKKNEELTEWQGVEMFRERTVAPHDPRKEVIYANFEKNLRDMVESGISAGATPIICTVAGNQRDFAPLASSGPVTPEHARGTALQSSNLFSRAAEAYGKALLGGNEHADLHFRSGQVWLELGSNTLARTQFEAARNLDALPLRTDGRMNEVIKKVAGEHVEEARLVDVDADLGAASPARTPGDELFFDHVHFTFFGNYRLARMIAAQIEKDLPDGITGQRATDWASAEDCDRALALTAWNRQAARENMMRRQVEPPFTDQSNHSRRIQAMARAISDLREELTAEAATNAAAIYQAALRSNERDFRLRENYAEFLEATGNFAGAAEQRVAIAEYVPHDPAACYHAGRMLEAAKKNDEARAWFARALELRPQFPEAHLETGRSFASEGRHEDALRSYAEALKLRADDARILVQQTHSLAALGRQTDAMDALRAAVKAQPGYWEPRYLLGVELAANNQVPAALEQFQEVTRLRPGYAQAHFNLAVALAKVGRLQEARMEFSRTLKIDPEHKPAQEYLGALERQMAR